MEDHPIAIDVKELTKRYGSAEILKDISFQVPVGKICVLLGPNGSGKTTLLKSLAGLLRPTSGEFHLHGVDPVKDPRGARAAVGWMPAEERSGFYGRLTGNQNLRFFGRLYGLSGETMDRTIGNLAIQIGIKDELDQTILRLSSGIKQRLALARALLHNPAILLLDEPIRSLDPGTVLRFRRLLRDHLTRIQKKTILLSTHLLDEARKVADMVLILKDGRIVKTVEAKDMEKELAGGSLEDLYLRTVEEEAPV